MADKKISQMETLLDLNDTEVIPVVRDGANFKTSPREIAKIGYQEILELPSSFTLDDSHLGVWLRSTSASPNSVQVPSTSTLTLAVGRVFNGIQAGEGATSFTPAQGVTINHPIGTTMRLRGKFSTYGLIAVGVDTWDLFGDLEQSA